MFTATHKTSVARTEHNLSLLLSKGGGEGGGTTPKFWVHGIAGQAAVGSAMLLTYRVLGYRQKFSQYYTVI